ncbi:MAG: glycosyltransferase [Endomicrobium sp.]|jgi:abequosyltransferase|nr:glycosyltransferase [Endomicrobium sp.]
MQYELSICIPTFNREKYLKDALDSIVNQIDDTNRDKVEICVSDNASQDNTKELVENYKKRHPHITYFRWDKNMGADNNFLKVIEIAHGKYCWFLGSDDIILKNSVKTVLSKIMDITSDIFYASAIGYDINLQNPDKQQLAIKIPIDIAYNNCRTIIKEFGIYFGCITNIIVLKEKWDRFALNRKFVGSAYQHLYICFEIIKNGGSICNTSKPLVGYRRSNDSFLDEGNFRRIQIDIVGYNDISVEVFGKNSAEAKNINYAVLKSFIYRHILIAILYNAANMKYRIKVFSLCLKYYKLYPIFWITSFPLLLIPAFILKSIRFIYRKVLKTNEDTNHDKLFT